MSPSPSRRHEAENPPAGRVLLAAGIIPLMVAACLLAAWAILAGWTRNRPLDPSVAVRGTIIAPGVQPLERFSKPNLELDAHTDLVAFRSRENSELENYGWIDRKSGVVRIPIDRAMDLLAQRGLPARATNQPATVGKSEYELSKERPSQP